MNIKTKFNIGDKVYPIEYSDIYPEVKCTFCDGNGNIEVKGHDNNIKEISCPTCHGLGDLVRVGVKQWHVLAPFNIETITFAIDDNIAYIEYDSIDEEDLFTTKKQAQAECNRRNKE